MPSRMDITLRDMEPGDFPLVHEMYIRLCHDKDRVESANRYLKFIFDKLFVSGTGRGWTACVGDEVAGIAAAIVEEHLFETPETSAIGEFIYVKKKYRKSGVGERLVREIFTTLGQHGAERIKVQLQPSNEQFNQMFIDLGFVKTATLYEWRPYEKTKSS